MQLTRKIIEKITEITVPTTDFIFVSLTRVLKFIYIELVPITVKFGRANERGVGLFKFHKITSLCILMAIIHICIHIAQIKFLWLE